MNTTSEVAAIDAIDRKIILASQGGLPLVSRPYHALAEQVGIPADEVMAACNAC